ncbi:hypothetical protein GPECTOR_8g199 [Gonium pectorale]|uniref:Oxidized purine nucleoside triphosphate hydrolase n=1 Tax=Gonium pectorale TaxID=33097 RepID=A0A150GSL8_GONPE|nr:hypothetical protein GPECTOR_8g199 [Gonium pectorale]|eukprot:KXZ52813.1 hypothetical protein GPECTOR_8g199 [Gonium pectorale]
MTWATTLAKADGGAPPFVRAVLESGTSPKLLTLVMIDDGKRVLLGHKKRGFGMGYYNGFGGKVEPGETIRQAAERELQEEACIEAVDLREAGVLVFAFDDQPVAWEVHVFAASSFRGEPAETDEMRPVWFNHEDVPFEQMWADDQFWYPLLLRRAYFRGVFAFTQTTQLLWHSLTERDPGDEGCP